MKKHITNEKTGISYTLIGDYYIPNLALPCARHGISRFGRLRLKYLKEHKRLLHLELLTSGKLNTHLHDVETQAQEMLGRLVKEYAKQQGVTERLKAQSQMEWVSKMNNIQNAVEEMILDEVVYR